MYIEAVDIKNIKSIEWLRMKFPEPAGWHVIIGDNGTGKSTIVRAIALGLIGPDEFKSVRIVLSEWLRQGARVATIRLKLHRNPTYDGQSGKPEPATTFVPVSEPVDANIRLAYSDVYSQDEIATLQASKETGLRSAFAYNWSNTKGWFSAGFGPFRRFTGGNKDWDSTYSFAPKAGAHLSLFGEDVALTESLRWMEKLYSQSIDSLQTNIVRDQASQILTGIKELINSHDFLPNGIRLDKVFTGGVIFSNSFGQEIPIAQLSDGFRSVLSLTFELIRQLGRVYSDVLVSTHLTHSCKVLLPGVVLIDEIDAHLHPTWQTRIGQWFTEHFPNIQFIVTTHSPLVCRAAENGSIYRLATPSSDEKSGEVTGIERDRLIYGNILDAYATDAFGDDVTQSAEAIEKLKRLTSLNARFAFNKLSKEEEKEMWHLRKIFTTDAPTSL